MTEEKFQKEILTLEKFFVKFCEDKHENRNAKIYNLEYKEFSIEKKIILCEDCHNTISYSFDRLKGCPHEIKPKCRQYPNPCYEKTKWKSLAKIMRYSGLRLGLINIKKKFKVKF